MSRDSQGVFLQGVRAAIGSQNLVKCRSNPSTWQSKTLQQENNNHNQAVHTDREVTANRPDIIIKNNKEKTCTLIDVAIPADRNVVQKEAENKLKYKSLCIEIQRMWNLKCTTVPVTVGATGIVTRSLKKNLETVPGKHSIDSLQKTAILGTSHTIRKVLQCEAWSVSGGDHRWFKRSTGKKRPVTETAIFYNNKHHE